MKEDLFLITEAAFSNLETRKRDFEKNPDIFLKNEPLKYSVGVFDIPTFSGQEKKSEYYYLKIQADGTAIANVFGTLDKNPDYYDEKYFGVINLTKLLLDVERAKIDSTVKKMVFVYDSPGGTVSGTPELAKAIYDFGKPNYGYVVGMCCSGALWLAVNHNNIYAANGISNYLGSVGVLNVHREESEFNKNYGLKYTVITNSDSPSKSFGNKYEPLSEEAKADIVRRANEIYQAFVETIKKNYPNVPNEFLEGKIFSANEAKNFGVIKSISEFKKIFPMPNTSGVNPANVAAAPETNLVISAAEGTPPPAVNQDIMAVILSIKASVDGLETKIEAKIEAKIDEKLSAFEERMKALEGKAGIKTGSNKVINLVENGDNFEMPKKPEYKSVATLPSILDDKNNVVRKFKSMQEHNNFLAVAEKYLSKEAFTPEFFGIAFDATRFNTEVGQFFEVVAFTYKENLLKYEMLKTLRMFDGVIDKITFATSYKKKFLSKHSEARRDVIVVETKPNSLVVEVLSGRTRQDMISLQQTALSYIDKPTNTDPYNVQNYWQWQIIYQSVLDSIFDDMGEAVWIGQANTYPVIVDEANPLNAFDGLLTIICKNLLLPIPDIGLHATGALTEVNAYQKLRDMLRAIPKDIMTDAKKVGKGVIYMNQNTYNKFLDAVKSEFSTVIYNTVFEHKYVYGYPFLPIVENDFLPDDAVIIDPTNVLAYATHTSSDYTNIKVEAHLFDIYMHGHLKLGAGIVDFYWNNPADLKYRVHVNDRLAAGYTIRPQL